MIRGAGRAAATGLLGALAGVVLLALLYGWHPALDTDFRVDPPAVVTGLYPVEQTPDGTLTFAWTSDHMTIDLPGLDRHLEWVLEVRQRGARPDGNNPALTFLADGVRILEHRSGADFETVRATIPRRPDRRGLTLSMQVSPTFVPGPDDPRPLGVTLDSMRLAPTGIVLPPREALAGTAAASGALGAGVALLGVTAGSAIGASIVIAAGTAAVVASGFGPYTTFPAIAARVSLAIAIGLVIAAALVEAAVRQRMRNTARFAAGFTASALLLKLLVLLHPDMPVGDAMFQAHRFQDVLGGRLFFTSVAPGGYLFPYAPGLYIFAEPFAGLVRRGVADMALLRIVTATVDALAGVLLYRMIVRARSDRIAGACAVALYHLVPLGFGVMTAGNLTNAFAQSLSVGALAMMAAPSLRLEHARVVGLFCAVVTCAFLSHTSTFAILSVAAFTVALLFLIRGGPALRSPAMAILIALGAAIVISVLLYYAHFMETYRTQFARIGAETATAAADAGGRGIVTRLVSVPRYLVLYFGIPIIALCAWGAVTLWRRGGADRLALSICGWAVACLAFLALGVLTPVDMRYYLASIPAVAVVAAMGASAAWSEGSTARITAGVLLGWALVTGIAGWLGALG